jgi:hypothetical protein
VGGGSGKRWNKYLVFFPDPPECAEDLQSDGAYLIALLGSVSNLNASTTHVSHLSKVCRILHVPYCRIWDIL